MLLRRTVANIGVVFVSQIVSRLFTVISLLLVLKVLSTEDYGSIALLQSLINVGSGLFLQGINWALIRALASQGRSDVQARSRIIWSAFILELLVVAFQSLLLFLFPGSLAGVFSSGSVSAGLVQIAAVGISTTALLTFLTTVLQGMERFREGAFVTIGHVAIVSLVYVGCWLTGRLTVAVVMFTVVAAPLAAFAAGAMLFGMHRGMERTWNLALIVQQGRDSLWFIVYTFLLLAVNQLDVFMIARYFSLADVGVYGFATRIYSVLLLSLAAVHTVLLPRLSSTPDASFLRQVRQKIVRWMIPAALILVLPVILWTRPIVVLLSSEAYEGAVLPLRILMAGAFFSLVLSPLTNILFALKQERFVAASGLLLCIVQWLGHIFVTQHYGAVGAAIVVAGGNTLVNGAVALRVYVMTSSRGASAKVQDVRNG